MSGGQRYRLGIATRGFRGGSGENLYINQTVELSDISIITDVSINVPTVTIDTGTITTDISLNVIEVSQLSDNIEVTLQDESFTIEVDQC